MLVIFCAIEPVAIVQAEAMAVLLIKSLLFINLVQIIKSTPISGDNYVIFLKLPSVVDHPRGLWI